MPSTVEIQKVIKYLNMQGYSGFARIVKELSDENEDLRSRPRKQRSSKSGK